MYFAAEPEYSDLGSAKCIVWQFPALAVRPGSPVFGSDARSDEIFRRYRFAAPVLEHLAATPVAHQLIQQLDDAPFVAALCSGFAPACGFKTGKIRSNGTFEIRGDKSNNAARLQYPETLAKKMTSTLSIEVFYGVR